MMTAVVDSAAMMTVVVDSDEMMTAVADLVAMIAVVVTVTIAVVATAMTVGRPRKTAAIGAVVQPDRRHLAATAEDFATVEDSVMNDAMIVAMSAVVVAEVLAAIVMTTVGHVATPHRHQREETMAVPGGDAQARQEEAHHLPEMRGVPGELRVKTMIRLPAETMTVHHLPAVRSPRMAGGRSSASGR